MALFDSIKNWTGLADDLQLRKQQISQAQMENQFRPEFLQSRNDMQSNQAGLLGAQLEYEPEKLRLANEYSGIRNRFAPADMGSEIDQRRASTDRTRMETKYTPLEMLLKAQNSKQQSSRFGVAYQLSKQLQSMPAATRALWIAENQTEFNEMLKDLANKNQEQDGNIINNGLLQKFFPDMDFPAPQENQSQSQSANVFKPPTPEFNERTKLASEMSANKELTTAATRRQMEGALQVENIVNNPKVKDMVVSASEYAGAYGKGKEALAALSQRNPKSYEDYQSLTNQVMPLLENRIKTLDQMGATDKQRDTLEGMWKKTMDARLSNPEQFVLQFNNLMGALDVVAGAVEESASPVATVKRLKGTSPIETKADLISVIAPNGSMGKIPAGKLDAALKKGFKRANNE